MNSDLMAQIHAKKALKALSLAEGACSSDAGTSNGTPLPSKAAPQKAVDESAPDLKAFKNQLAGLFGGPSSKAPTPAAASSRAAEPQTDVPVQSAAAPAAPPPTKAAATPLTPTPSTRVGLAVGSSRCTLSSHNSPVDEDLVEDLCPGGAGRQLKLSSLELAPQHRQRLGREVAAEVLVRRQGVGDAKPHAARPRQVAGRGDAQGLVHRQRGVVCEEAQHQLGQRLLVGRGRWAPIGTPGLARSARHSVAVGKER